MSAKWRRVRRSEPCPICGHTDFCTIANSGDAVHCMRVESDNPSSAKIGGWIHRYSGKPIDGRLGGLPGRQDDEKLPQAEVERLVEQFCQHPSRDVYLRTISTSWGVPMATLKRMRIGVGVDDRGETFVSFPCVDDQYRPIGIIRRYRNGRKLTYKGTRNAGLFLAPGWEHGPGPVLIVEGASDTLVAYANGLAAIGRPSNLGGCDLVASVLERCGVVARPIVVIGENDRKPEKVGTIATCPSDCPGCNWCFPGFYGARSCAERLKRFNAVVMMPPSGVKDLREWSTKSSCLAADVIVNVRMAQFERVGV